MSKAVNQHYVPKWYLELFASAADRKRRVVFRRIGGGGTWIPASPRNLCSENYFNAYRSSETGEWNHQFDDFVGKIENARDIVVGKICKKVVLTLEDREKLSLFAALMAIGVPSYRNNVAEFVEKVFNQMAAMNYARFTKDPQLFEKFKKESKFSKDISPEIFNPEKIKAKAEKGYIMSLCFENVVIVAQLIYAMGWSVLCSKSDCAFITSDCPVVLCEPNPDSLPEFMGVGFGSPSAILLLPLTKNHLLFASHAFGKENFSYISAENEQVESINVYQALYARQTLIAESPSFPGNNKVNHIIDRRNERETAKSKS